MGLRSWMFRFGSRCFSSRPTPAPRSFADNPPAAALAPPLAPLSGSEQQFLYAEELNNQGRPELAVAFYRQAYVLLRGQVDLNARPAGGQRQLALPDRSSGQPVATAAIQTGAASPEGGPAGQLTALREKLTSANAAAVEQDLRQLIQAGHRNGDSFGLFGMSLLLQKRPDEAERAFRESLKYDPSHYRSMVNLGGLLLKKGQLQEAIQLLERALQHTKEGSVESLAALSNLAVAQSQIGNTMEASKTILRIFRIKPDHLQPEKLAAAATNLEAMGDDLGAIELLQHLRSHLRDPEHNRRLAELLERRGDYQQAALVYRELAGASTGTP